MKQELAKAEEQGRGGDRLLGHLTPGDVIIPRGRMSEELRSLLAPYLDLDTYTAGNEKNSINPITGLPEFMDGAGSGGMDGGGDKGAGMGNENDGKGEAGQGGINSGLGDGSGSLGPDSALNNDNSKGWGGINSQNGGWLEGVLGALAHPDAVGPSAMDGTGVGGGVDGHEPGNPLLPAPNPPPVNFGSSLPALNAPAAPDVPDSVPGLGNYYYLLSQGNQSGAANLLSQFMRGDANVYGR